METSKLKKFAQFARRSLLDQVSAKMELVLDQGSSARRENPAAIEKLEQSLQDHGKEMVIEQVAYTWFNRFCALRFMDVNHYTRIGIVSPAEGQLQPEILAEAKMGHINEDIVSENVRAKVFAFLNGTAASPDPQAEAYRLLLVSACNYWNGFMPFMFERIADYTELLLPDDLLSENSILFHVREAMTPDNCTDVEIIGWLYQFYISEKKDEIINRRSVVKKEDIPAATQLFTPKWIVRYLVENSLGRLWMLNRPDSKLIEQMEYYIKPDQPETDFLRISSPEEIKICDPACGSGHMLVYAFVLLYAIYLEEGYEPSKIPAKILTNNLFGIEIDKRAADLAAFALFMLACQYDKRFFRRMASKGQTVRPNICVLKKVRFEDDELRNYMKHMGPDLFSDSLKTTLRQFEEADNFGSLIRPHATDVNGILKTLKSKNVSGHLLLSMTHDKVLRALKYADYLNPKYHVVIANPPYMGLKGMNPRLKTWASEHYKAYKTDLFSMSIMRVIDLTLPMGDIGLVTPFVWMFISSYKSLREKILNSTVITSLVQLEYNAFAPACIPVCAFTLFNSVKQMDLLGSFIQLSNFRGSENQASRTLEAITDHKCGWHFSAKNSDFFAIPELTIGYWLPRQALNEFKNGRLLREVAHIKQGLATGENAKFVRCWHEVENYQFGPSLDYNKAIESEKKWFPYNKGGDYRKWYGNQSFVVDWENNGLEIRNFSDENGKIKSRPQNIEYFFKTSLSWSKISSSKFALRLFPMGFIFDVAGCSIFLSNERTRYVLLGVMNSKIMTELVQSLSPTLNFEVGQVGSFPLADKLLSPELPVQHIVAIVQQHKKDWNSYETSWDFTHLPILNPDHRQPTLKATYQKLRAHWQEMTLEMQRLEEENNRIFIEAYGLQDELTPDVPLKEITLTCNPYYRYGKEDNHETRETHEKDNDLFRDFSAFRGSKIFPVDEEIEARLLTDTMREFISYSVGCMFGRYSLDKPGLILANQGETIEDYLKQIPDPTFLPDNENVIPILDGDWFTDDMAERFKEFLKITFGQEYYEDNLRFIEKALGKDLRKYLLKDFYSDHVRRYKKRPIYWMFSSPKGSFNALIYMHRYQPDTVSVVLNKYLREFLIKLNSRKQRLEGISSSTNASSSEKTRAINEMEKLKKIISELEEYERKVLYPLAVEKIEIDLDDGVKINYPKFGKALKKVPGLST